MFSLGLQAFLSHFIGNAAASQINEAATYKQNF